MDSLRKIGWTVEEDVDVVVALRFDSVVEMIELLCLAIAVRRSIHRSQHLDSCV